MVWNSDSLFALNCFVLLRVRLAGAKLPTVLSLCNPINLILECKDTSDSLRTIK